MVSLTSKILDTNAASHTSLMNANASGSANAFAQQLESAIEGYLANSGNGSQFEINVTTNSGQNSVGGSQFTVTVKNLDSGTSTASAAASTAATTATATASTTTATTTAATTASTAAEAGTGAVLTAAQKAEMTPTQAYWASQPPAVQALETTPDDERPALAQQLASQGYAIDVPIMVWGWDPLSTMIARQTAGYTWVPSAMQSSIQEAPGVGGVVGATPYDPSNPPAGSIPVSTAFAVGTNISADAVAEMEIRANSFTVGTPATSTT